MIGAQLAGQEIYDRLVNRRVCSVCNTNSPVSKLKDGKCPECGGEVYQRTDDNDASIQKRIDFYKKEVLPVVDYYKNNGYNVVTINADKSIEEVASQIESAIKSVK